MEVEQYVKQFREITSKLNGRGKQAVALQILHEMSKDRRMAQAIEARNGNGKFATARQIAFAQALGIELPESITKKEATKLITEQLQKRNLNRVEKVK